MNQINIEEPRWHKKDVLIADWKISAQNEIVIKHTRKDGSLTYPNPAYMTGEQLKTYPAEYRSWDGDKKYCYRVVPLVDLLERTDYGRQSQTS